MVSAIWGMFIFLVNASAFFSKITGVLSSLLCIARGMISRSAEAFSYGEEILSTASDMQVTMLLHRSLSVLIMVYIAFSDSIYSTGSVMFDATCSERLTSSESGVTSFILTMAEITRLRVLEFSSGSMDSDC